MPKPSRTANKRAVLQSRKFQTTGNRHVTERASHNTHYVERKSTGPGSLDLDREPGPGPASGVGVALRLDARVRGPGLPHGEGAPMDKVVVCVLGKDLVA